MHSSNIYKINVEPRDLLTDASGPHITRIRSSGLALVNSFVYGPSSPSQTPADASAAFLPTMKPSDDTLLEGEDVSWLLQPPPLPGVTGVAVLGEGVEVAGGSTAMAVVVAAGSATAADVGSPQAWPEL